MRHYGREYLGHWVLALVLAGVALLPLDYGSRQRSLHVLLRRVLSHSGGRLQTHSFGLEPFIFDLLLISGFRSQSAEG